MEGEVGVFPPLSLFGKEEEGEKMEGEGEGEKEKGFGNESDVGKGNGMKETGEESILAAREGKNFLVGGRCITRL